MYIIKYLDQNGNEQIGTSRRMKSINALFGIKRMIRNEYIPRSCEFVQVYHVQNNTKNKFISNHNLVVDMHVNQIRK